jgi:hypothetical protein
MEKIDKFSLRNHSVRTWLLCLLLVALAIAVCFPPAFWLDGPGALLLVLGILANSHRTDQWMSWEHEGSLNGFEGWTVCSGLVLICAPLLVAIARSAWSV